MDEKKFNENDLELVLALSMAPTKFDKYVILLKKDFGYTITKAQLAIILDKSEQTIDRRIKESCNIPNFIRSGEGKNASYIFPVAEVAEYLSNTIKTA